MGNQEERFLKECENFTKQHHFVTVTLFEIIGKIIKVELEIEEKEAFELSAQIVNYYMGIDINKIKEPHKTYVIKNKDLIIRKAEELLQKDKIIREIVVYTLRMYTVYSFAAHGEEFLKSQEHKNQEDILKRYGNEFPAEAKPKLYDKIFLRFYIKYQKQRDK